MILLENIYNSPLSNNFFDKYGFIISEKSFEAGCHFPLHWHDYFELEIILEGSVEHCLNNTTSTISPGSIFLLSYSDIHSVRTLSKTKLLNIRFSENFLPKDISNYILQNNTLTYQFNDKEFDYIRQRINAVDEIDENDLFSVQMMQNFVSDIVIILIQKSAVNHSAATSSAVQKVISYILNNFRKDISLKSVAQELYMTPNYLGSIFKKNTNKTFHQYVNSLRLKYACNLLASSELSIQEIAFSSGYNSVEHFMLTFKKNINTTPASYRKMCLQNENKQ